MKFASIITVLFVLGTSPSAFSDELEPKEISKSRYITGGVVGSVVGFGTGHAIQNRYRSDKGWIFTVGEAAPLVLIIGSVFVHELGGGDTPDCTSGEARSYPERCRFRRNEFTSGPAMTVFAATFLGLKIWETVDLWNYDYNGSKKASAPTAKISILPSQKGEATANLTITF